MGTDSHCLTNKTAGSSPAAFSLVEPGRDRTADLYNAIVALSQLSYGPSFTAMRSLRHAPRGVNRRPAQLGWLGGRDAGTLCHVSRRCDKAPLAAEMSYHSIPSY